MLTRADKAKLRGDLFRHLDGIAVAPTAYALHEVGLTNYLLEHKEASLEQLAEQFKANKGYLNVALRLLCSQGWLIQNLDNRTGKVVYQTNDKTAKAFSLFPLYSGVNELLKFTARFHKRKFEMAPFLALKKIMDDHKSGYGLETKDEGSIEYQILKHIEGIIVGPTTVHLGMSGMFHKYFMETSFRPEEFHSDTDAFIQLLDYFTWLGWYEKSNETYSFTDKGLFFAKRAAAYGVTVSYIPTFRHLDQLIFGDPAHLRNIQKGKEEIHVDREMNVWGSGGAHSAYFKKLDEVIIDIFNKPIEEQPKGLLDMGCGNGAFLAHAFEVISSRTLRGTMLEDHPLFLVGADYNQAAIKVTRANLIQQDIWAKVIWGDISRPDLLDDHLQEVYDIKLGDLLNARTFLDHNRIWSKPTTVNADRVSQSTGAFAYKGDYLTNNMVEDNLKEHFGKWMPYVKKHGLLLIELHTVDPALVAQNIGRTAATAYDGTHGYSDQFILELSVFLEVVAKAGLHKVDKYSYRFPDSELATVSINLLVGA